ncbi:MAG: type II toxin-antitoxin system HicB family antitoxin [Eubacteriales bacterium]|nr:type II toxin-antitoxin system HicB family antitoxin [Eubacteriales bacterium]
MHFVYPAVFRQTEEGGYTGYFPDLEQCFAKGDTLDEVLNDAIAEAKSWIQVELEDTFDLPSVSHPNDLDLKEGEFVRNIGVTIRLTDGWDE